MPLSLLLVLLLAVRALEAASCSSNSFLPFSGFKVARRHVIYFFPLRSHSFLVLTQCHRGLPVYSVAVPTPSAADEFSVPFCASNSEPLSEGPPPFTRLSSLLGRLRWRRILQAARTKFTSPGPFPQKKSPENAPFVPSNSSSLSEHKCLKMARRKRYARSNVVIFIPTTFVGVLFTCDVSGEEGPAQNQTSSDGAEKPQFVGEPVCPLLADDYSSHWASVQISPPAIVYNVPYLKSPSFWDFRFRSGQDSWLKEADINESYQYSSVELAHISDALAVSLSYVQKLLALKASATSGLWSFNLSSLRALDLRLRLSLLMSSLSQANAYRHLMTMQKTWDNSTA